MPNLLLLRLPYLGKDSRLLARKSPKEHPQKHRRCIYLSGACRKSRKLPKAQIPVGKAPIALVAST